MNPGHADESGQRDDEHRISYFEMWKSAAALALKMEAERDQWKQAAELNAADMRSEYARANFLEMERDRLREDAKRWEGRAYRVRRVPVNDGRSDSDYWAEIDAEIEKNRAGPTPKECISTSVITSYVESYEAFSAEPDLWQVRLSDGQILKPTWNSKGAAEAGAMTELRRIDLHVISRDCWCNPEVVAP